MKKRGGEGSCGGGVVRGMMEEVMGVWGLYSVRVGIVSGCESIRV